MTDTLVLNLSEDAYKTLANNQDAQFTVTVDGTAYTPTQGNTVTTLHDTGPGGSGVATGLTQPFTITGIPALNGNKTHTVVITYTNDLYGGTLATDRNLWIDSLKVTNTAGFTTTYTGSSATSTTGTAAKSGTAQELQSGSASATYTVACFLRGTRLAVPGGERAVEDLRDGDLVLTASGEQRPVVWIGHRRLDVARHPEPDRVRPVRLRAGSIADGVPARDLLVSPEHMMLLDGVLVPARALVNGTTITTAPDVAEPHYFHVELDSHDVLLAEGAAAESWLDVGNRGMFANAPVPFLVPAPEPTPAARACAPVVDGGPLLAAVRDTLAARAAELGDAAREEVLILDAPGAHYALVRPGSSALRLASPGVLGDGDQRRLGATVTAILVNGEALALDDARLVRGFHVAEDHGGHLLRWTDGDALIALGAEGAPRVVEVRVGTVAAPALAA